MQLGEHEVDLHLVTRHLELTITSEFPNTKCSRYYSKEDKGFSRKERSGDSYLGNVGMLKQ